MAKIRVLPDSVARRIAAGEVVERPVSVVKELVENSLDAGARRIVIEIEQGGRSRIAVSDDGEGIARDDVAVAFRPHATSKIRSEEDLFRVTTLGFRGEALPSIAAVADVELWTARRGDPLGTRVHVRGGDVVAVEDAGAAPGCRIEVRELFHATPARKKFLKAPGTETGHVTQLIGRFAVAEPEVAFTLACDGRETMSLPSADRRERIRRVLGRDVAAALRPVSWDGAVRISGFVTHPHFSAPSARGILFFVNRRLIRDRVLQHAVVSAYAMLLPRGRYPAAVVFLEIDPADVDVNVHPSKLEIRFRDSRAVHDAIAASLRETLGRLSSSPQASNSDAAAAAPGATAVAEAAGRYRAEEWTAPASGDGARPLRLVDVAPAEPPLFTQPGPYSSVRIVGQLFDGYLLCEAEGELVLIDQHAAHERVAFERLRAERRARRVETQAMLVPQPIELDPGAFELVVAAAAELADCGLQIESFGDRTILVRSTPALLPPAAIPPLLRAVAADLAEVDGSRAIEDRADRFLATIACHSVVRVGQRLSEAEMKALLAAMDTVALNSNCPHGRPVALRISRAELERRFGR